MLLTVSTMRTAFKTKTSHHPQRDSLQTQDYFDYLCPADARLLFSIRSGTLDLKMLRKYAYESGDTLCRLCVSEDETVDHIVNRCGKICRSTTISDVHSLERKDVEAVVARVKLFVNLVEDLNVVSE